MAISSEFRMTFGQQYGDRKKGLFMLLIIVILSIVSNSVVSAD